MNDSNKWIKLHSKMLDWEWYKNINVKTLFIHCLLKANWKDGKFQGQLIKRGSFVTSLEMLSKETNLSTQQVRTSLQHLISTSNLTSKSYNKFRIISVVNYDMYQQGNNVINKQITNNQQTDNKQVTTIVEYKNNRIIDNNIITTTTKEEKKENLFEFVEKEFGRTLSESEFNVIQTWDDNEVTRYAITQASIARVNNIRYVSRILDCYKKENVTSVVEAEERDRRHQNQKLKYQKTNEPKKETGMEYLERRKKELEL
jgi:DnaD/phage-associated family protein